MDALKLGSQHELAAFLRRNKKPTTLAVAILTLGIALKMKTAKPKRSERSHSSKNKVAVNKEFFANLVKLLGIVMPSVLSKEACVLFVHSVLLVLRTFMSIYIAKLDGRIVKALVERSNNNFFRGIFLWLAIALPATFTNSMIRFFESVLATSFRSRLTRHSVKLYMGSETYYRVSNLDSRIANADQCLTDDVSKWCSSLAHLHSSISKPLLDVTLFSWELSRNIGYKPMFGATAVVALTGEVLRLCAPPFGKLVADQAKREGELRFVHSRLIANAEEIAFYGGHEVEKGILDKAYKELVSHMNTLYRRRIPYNTLEGFFLKYVWGAFGLLMCARPVLAPSASEDAGVANAAMEAVKYDAGESTQGFITNRRLLTSGSDALERLMESYKEVVELAGYTSRVAEMVNVFEDMAAGKYVKKTVNAGVSDITKLRGAVSEADAISLTDVPVVSPNGDILVEKLSFKIERGMHLLISGPNGCGKSSLFRMLGGLWPVHGGALVRPQRAAIFYIPQRPYLSLGTLRDQVIYPDNEAAMQRRGKTDADLRAILKEVNLEYIVEREGGWSANNDWKDVLSGGEKQRIAMARLFYHKPKFALLDECTSAVSMDIEDSMYRHAIDLDITLLTVTHRPSLWKHHTHLLQFDGQGNTHFGPLNATEMMTLKDEKTKLEAAMKDLPKHRQRLRELCTMLGEEAPEW